MYQIVADVSCTGRAVHQAGMGVCKLSKELAEKQAVRIVFEVQAPAIQHMHFAMPACAWACWFDIARLRGQEMGIAELCEACNMPRWLVISARA